MRRLIPIVVLLSALLFYHEVQAALANLLNPSFETDSDSDLLPDNWKKNGKIALSPSGDGRDCTAAYDGVCSFRIVGAGTGKKLSQTVVVSGPAIEQLKLNFWTKGESVGGGGAYKI
jgi:hypothetical protein